MLYLITSQLISRGIIRTKCRQKVFDTLLLLLRKAYPAAVLLVVLSGKVIAEDFLMPFVLAYRTTGDLDAITTEVREKLVAGGFSVAGEYIPYDGAHIIVVTNDELKREASKSEFGGFGAIQRISVTRNGDNVEVSYTNPVYMAAAYRMADDLASVRGQLEEALGATMDYGSEEDLTWEDLRQYKYRDNMLVSPEQFSVDDFDILAKYPNQKAALRGVENALADGRGNTRKIYRVDIPGKDETVFGVAMLGPPDKETCGDVFIMSKIDRATPRSTAHLPYEILVSNGTVYSLSPRFRIAINWPHLPMVLSTGPTFYSILCAPNSIREKLLQSSGGKP
jgi:hypothetical protein